MAKAIKRVGVIFLAVAIMCLMAIGVILGVNGAKSETVGSLNLNNEIENNLQKTIDLTSGAQATKWNEAVQSSMNNGGANVNVVLQADWLAPTDTHSFGTGVGFSEGRILVPKGATISLFLNGHKINRRLTTELEKGQVILLNGILNLYDSVSGAPNKTTTGTITGGCVNTFGGGIYLDTKAILNMYGGIIAGNTASYNGGGVYANGGQVVLYDGIVKDNTAAAHGGGIYVCASVDFEYGFIMYGGEICNNYASYGGGYAVYNAGTGIMYDGYIHNNTTIQNSAGVLVYGNSSLIMNGGVISENTVTYHNNSNKGGGGLMVGVSSKFIMNGGEIINNKALNESTESVRGAGILVSGSTGSIVTLNKGVISGNSSQNLGGGFYIDESNCSFSIGGGMQIYGNTANGVENNLHLKNGQAVYVTEKLVSENSSTHIGVTLGAGTGLFTLGYLSVGNSLNPSRFFFSDIAGKAVSLNNGEVQITNGTKPTSVVTWKWGNGANQSTTKSHVTLPYTGSNYAIGNNINQIKKSNGDSATEFKIADVGTYAFYVDGTYLNPTFTITIEKNVVEKPEIKNYVMFNTGREQQVIPEWFDEQTMYIFNNKATDIGEYTALVRLKWGKTWEDGTNGDLNFKFQIIPRGIEGKENSSYTHIYLENGYRKSYEDKYEHLINDKEVETSQGKYVLGNISAQTSVKAFINNLRNESNKIKLYDNNNTLVYDGIASGGVVADNLNNVFVATGYKVEYYYNNNLYDTMYLSILGDVVADGVINTLDVTYINRIAKGEIALSELSLEQQLAAMVDNKGKVTSTDGKILLNVIGGNTQTNSYFESNANITNDYMLLDLSIDSVTGKTYRVGSEITTASLVNNAIIGNIAPQTKASDLKTNLASQLGVDISVITIHKANGAVANDSDYIGTGCYINYNGNTANKIYLSVLGDLTGDGVVNTADITYLNRIVNGNVELATDNIKDKLTILSASIQNKGNITTADSETLLNYIGGIADLTKYF